MLTSSCVVEQRAWVKGNSSPQITPDAVALPRLGLDLAAPTNGFTHNLTSKPQSSMKLELPLYKLGSTKPECPEHAVYLVLENIGFS